MPSHTKMTSDEKPTEAYASAIVAAHPTTARATHPTCTPSDASSDCAISAVLAYTAAANDV